MKRFIITLFVFTQSFCYAAEDCRTDSIESGFQVFGNDTLVTVKYGNFISRGLKRYIDDSPVYYNNADYDVIHYEGNEYIHHNMLKYIQDILNGYGKEQCKEMFALFYKSGNTPYISVRIRVNIEGIITCVDFFYSSELNPFMTYEDIKRNTRIMVDRKPQPYLAEYGIELSPWISFPISGTALQKYLEQVADFKYYGETVRFDYRQDSIVNAFVKEEYNDTTNLDGGFSSTENKTIVSEYLQDKDVLVAIDSVQKVAIHYLRFVEFEEGKDVTIRLKINEMGEVTGTVLVFPTGYKRGIWPEHICIITKKIQENIRFTPPGKYGCNTIISIDIPVNELQLKCK